MLKYSMTRRQFLRVSSASLCSVPLASLIVGCEKGESLVRIASNVWPGYELLYLARSKSYFSDQQVRLVEVPSATVCIQSLAAGTVEGAMLTLDEVLTARAEGINLRVVAVLDISMGADVMLVKPEIKNLSQLKGKRIGVEQSAVGAIMMDAILQKANLKANEVNMVYMTVNRHQDAYLNNEIDALITFEPVKTQLLTEGATRLFDSSEIPGRIIDVLAVLPRVIENRQETLKEVVAGHFKARDYFLNNATKASELLARRLQIPVEQVPGTFQGMELPDVNKNHEMLSGDEPALAQSAGELAKIMQAAFLLPQNVSLKKLIDGRFLPKAKS